MIAVPEPEPVAIVEAKPAVQSGEVFYEGEDPYVTDEPTPNVTSDDVHHDHDHGHGHVHAYESEPSYHAPEPEPVYYSESSESDHYHPPVQVHHDDHSHGHGHDEEILHAHGDLVHAHAGGDQYHKHLVEEEEEEEQIKVIKTPVEKAPYKAEVVKEIQVV